MAKLYFIAGTDTGVGKTLVSCTLLRSAAATGLRTIGLKPVAAGCEDIDGSLKNDDALQIAEAASIKMPYAQTNPVALKLAASPHIAAARENRTVSAERVAGICRGALMQKHDLAIVEGAGGWRVPISPRETMADLARVLGGEVILVVALRLGCLNHALLTAEAVRRDGLKLAGWVANQVGESAMEFESENIATLQSALAIPYLGKMPFLLQDQQLQADKYLNTGALFGDKL